MHVASKRIFRFGMSRWFWFLWNFASVHWFSRQLLPTSANLT